jgi:rare lipoprotein A
MRIIGVLLALVLCVCSVAEAKNKRVIANTSWYNCCKKTASGELLDPTAMTVAHRTLPFGTRVLFMNPANGTTACARVNDRGPFVRDRVWDGTRAFAIRLRFIGQGVAYLTWTVGGC